MSATGLCWAALAAAGADLGPLRNGDTVVFLGDSITQAGGYVAALEAYLLAQRPSDSLRFVNVGLSSETASGLSEPDHPGKRPCIHDRFARDVAPLQPNVVLVCYGMNDGIYHPPDPARRDRYQSGMKRLVARLFAETPARAVVLLSPPPYDNHRWKGDPQAKTHGYRFPAPDYDRVLAGYGAYLETLAQPPRVTVVDVHAAALRHLAVRRAERVSYAWAEDAVHPGATGHWVMAQAVLRAWAATPAWQTLALDAAGAKSAGVDFRWRTAPLALPVFLDRAVDPKTWAVERVADDLARQTIRIAGLPEGRKWRLSFAGEPLGTHGTEALARGIGPVDWANAGGGAERFLTRATERRRVISNAFLAAMKAPGATPETVAKAIAGAEAAQEAPRRRLDELRTVAPRDVVCVEVR